MFYRITLNKATVVLECKTFNTAMEWMLNKSREYNPAYLTWFTGKRPGVVLELSIAGQYYAVNEVNEVPKVRQIDWGIYG